MIFNFSALRALFGFAPAVPAPAVPVPAAPPNPVPAAPARAIAAAVPERGVRNNNPGNIDRDGTVWEGMAADQSGDDRFIVFTTAAYGIRALVVILKTYQEKDACTTIRQMINRWAPRQENNTAAYVDFVAGRVGISADIPIDIEDWTLCGLMTSAIIAQENANYAYPPATIDAGMKLAGIMKPGAEA